MAKFEQIQSMANSLNRILTMSNKENIEESQILDSLYKVWASRWDKKDPKKEIKEKSQKEVHDKN